MYIWKHAHISAHSKRVVIVCLCFLLLEGIEACSRSGKAHGGEKFEVQGEWMVDEAGRARLFHGFNAVKKSFPWYPDTLTEADLRHYQAWGLNFVRLGIMWSGVNPAEGVTNTTYITMVRDMVERAGKHGLYVLLDMHQDVISSRFASYDGVPRWVINKMPPSEHAYPWPLTNLSQWADGYLTEAVGNAFQCLYDNVAQSRDHMVKFWQTVAVNFKDYPNVLGYELINEPWAGDIYKDPGLLLPGNAGRQNLAPLYEVLNKAIREIDNDTLFFYEPVTWGMVFPGTADLGNGFRSVPGGAQYVNRSVMSWHYYCWILAIDDKKPYGTFERLTCDGVLGPLVFDTVIKDIQRTGGGAFLTEFGLCEPDGNNDTQTMECEFVLSQADAHLQSWAYWDSEFFTPNGDVKYDVVRGFARVYATAIAGTPLSMTFNANTRQFSLAYEINADIKEATEIKVPKLQYPDGFRVKVSAGLRYEFNETSSTLFVRSKLSWSDLKINPRAMVTILPKHKALPHS